MNYVWLILGAVIVILGLIFVLSDQPPSSVDQQVRITLTEWKITPNTIELRPGPVRFTVLNMGTLPHALALVGTVNGQKFERHLEGVEAAQMRVFLLDLPRGEFTIYDPLHCRDPIRGSCEKKTMVGKLVVR